MASKSDKASLTLYNALLDLDTFIPTGDEYHGTPIYVYQNVSLVLDEMKGIFLNDLDEFFAPQSYVFLSKHRSESGLPTLTAHFTGNFSDNVIYGGNPREIAWTDPKLLKALIAEMQLSSDIVRLDSQVKYGAVARGEAEIYLRPRSRPDWRENIWDHAAGVILAQMAGGRVSDHRRGASMVLTDRIRARPRSFGGRNP